jgi:hypothetical protein
MITQKQSGFLRIKTPLPNQNHDSYVFELSGVGSDYSFEEVVQFCGAEYFIKNLRDNGYKLFFHGDPGLTQERAVSKFIYYILEEFLFSPLVWMERPHEDKSPGMVLQFCVKKWVDKL